MDAPTTRSTYGQNSERPVLSEGIYVFAGVVGWCDGAG